MKRFLAYTLIICSIGCSKFDEFTEEPDLQPLDHGFKTSAAIGFCASLARNAFKGEPLPPNVVFDKRSSEYSNSGLLYVKISEQTPLPFNTSIGDIVIAGMWDDVDGGGVISILFADINLLNSEVKFYGVYTVPLIEKPTGELVTLFAQQDIVIGEGSDTILNLSLSRPRFDAELNRLNQEQPGDVFAAVSQNVWYLNISHSQGSGIYDDLYKLNGGGQVVQATSKDGGILYHALINTQFSYNECKLNPFSGTGFVQNLKAGTSLDLGGILLDFHEACDGKSHVKLGTGKYAIFNGKNINLNWQ